jgi:hypothetical protein
MNRRQFSAPDTVSQVVFLPDRSYPVTIPLDVTLMLEEVE